MSNKILVIGATGKTGSRVYERLKQKGAEVLPASRNSQVPFDWYNAETWSNALNGIKSVYITFQPDLAVPDSLQMITGFVQSAKNAGVEKLVLLSGRGEAEAMACEKIIADSGLAWTILRASFFMQNFSEGFWLDGILSRDFVIPAVTAKEPFVDADDIADVAVEALITDDHNDKTYELTGPHLLSFKEVIQKISGAINSDIGLVELPLKEYEHMLRTYQVPDDVIWLISYLFTEVLDGRNESVCNDIESVLHRKATSFDAYVEKTLLSGNWTAVKDGN